MILCPWITKLELWGNFLQLLYPYLSIPVYISICTYQYTSTHIFMEVVESQKRKLYLGT